LANRNEVREEELEAVLDSYREAFSELKKGNSFWNPPL